jgi:predicted outer membrane repeat protein
VDTSTTYKSNAAIKGGALFLSSTPATLSKIIFDGNWANQGGAIYIEGTSTIVLSELNVIKSRAL